jgi:indolepyruvate ferredoxin oxidoreductase beta subunit
MNTIPTFDPAAPGRDTDQIIKLAVLAVGGQGGGVLTSWIETLARAQGYVAQATSVAGVAQRTGTTVYYVEMARQSDRAPVFSLAPAAGDVDIVIAAEMMEAGRAIQRGFVTPDRTVLIASTHRALAFSEKSEPGNGIKSADQVRAAAEIAARQLVMADLEHVALENGSVISASLFGALAGSGALPFPRAAFEEAIRASGRSVAPSLQAVAAACDLVERPETPAIPTVTPVARDPGGPAGQKAQWQQLCNRIAEMPEALRDMGLAGLRKTVDFQDLAYGALYLDRVQSVLALDVADNGYALSVEAAKHIANAMAYDDVIRVADLKTRAARFDRIRQEMQVTDGQLLALTEYMHPRAEEIAGMMPERFGQWFQASPARMARLDRWFCKGRRLRSDSIPSFVMLYIVGGMRRHRLRSLRHAQEVRHLTDWLTAALAMVPADYALSVEMIRARRLIKGYSDTHSRGLGKFDKVMGAAAQLAGRPDAADWLRRLIAAALQDEDGVALDGALTTIRQEILPAG